METLVDVTSNSVEDITSKAKQLYAETFCNATPSPYLLTRVETISDAELESALTGIPNCLFSMSTLISEIILKRDSLKKQVKSIERELKQSSSNPYDLDNILSDIRTLDQTISVYDYMINRATSEVSAAKEYLMSIKKIWDRRRSTEHSVPIAEKDYKLPEYQFDNTGESATSTSVQKNPTFDGKAYIC